MRLATALLALLAQDPPARSYTFVAEQGWVLAVDNERDLVSHSERELTRGIHPNIRLGQDQPGTLIPETPGRAVPKSAPAKAPPSSGPATYRRIQGDPFRVEGTLTLRPDGNVAFGFQKIHYADGGQRWGIEFDRDKVRTSELGGQARWTGTRAEWLTRLEALEKTHVENYARAVTPQPEENRPKVGLAAASPEAGRRLYVLACLEEQMALLLLARLEGAPLSKTLWPADTAKYPPRAILAARAFVDRLTLQATGELAPAKVRALRKNQPWDGQGPAIPAFPWTDGAAWAAEQLKPLQDGRRRLEELAERTRVAGIDLLSWDTAVRAELARLDEASKAATPKDALLTPRALAPCRGTFDFKEELEGKDGNVISSQAESVGVIRDFDVAWFMSGPNRWRTARIRLETLYKGQVKLKP